MDSCLSHCGHLATNHHLAPSQPLLLGHTSLLRGAAQPSAPPSWSVPTLPPGLSSGGAWLPVAAPGRAPLPRDPCCLLLRRASWECQGTIRRFQHLLGLLYKTRQGLSDDLALLGWPICEAEFHCLHAGVAVRSSHGMLRNLGLCGQTLF